MQRRLFLKSTALSTPALGLTGCASTLTNPVINGESPFQHGVASGDPLSDRVILWTRVSPTSPTETDSKLVSWWIGLDENGNNPVQQGESQAKPEHDYTFKVDATGLAPNERYFYGFEHQGFRSDTGRTRTLPNAAQQTSTNDAVRLAVTSCANYPQGYFNAYRHIANTNDLNAVLSLGDYLYEYGEGEYGNGEALDRVPEPPHETLSLSDYRVRHAQHKAEPDLQAAHAAHPWIVIWDDHESANNSWQDGAENHTSDEGDWSTRKTAAIKAYYEWMPIRELPSGLFRHFRFGKLADLVMLDTRLTGRDEQVEANDLDGARAPERSLLGPVQEQLFLDHLTATNADSVRWKVVGQQIVFAPWSNDDTLLNPDSWDGYRASREKVLEHLQDGEIDDVIVLTGDVHSAWGMNITNKDRTQNQAIELVTAAVSSPPLASASARTAELVSRATIEQPHIKYAEGLSNGYLIVDLNANRARAEWYTTGARTERSEQSVLDKALVSLPGSNELTEPEQSG